MNTKQNNIIKKTINRALSLLLILSCFASVALAEDKTTQELEKIKTVLPQKLDTARLNYHREKDFSRFIIGFDRLPPYQIKSDKKSTQIIFQKPFQIAGTNLKNYPYSDAIKFQSNASGNFILSFPEGIKNSFEQQNKIIVDIQNSDNNDYTQGSDQIQERQAAGNVDTVAVSKVRSLSFSWNMPVNISVFKRNDYLWIIFDHPQTFNIEELNASAEPLAEDVIQLPNNAAAIIRLKPKEGTNVNIRKEGLLWIVDLYTGPDQTEIKEFPIFTQYDIFNNSYLFLPGSSAGKIISIFDPDIGDIINIITTDETNLGMKNAYYYPDVEILPSYAGLVSILNADDLTIDIGNTGISIRRIKKGLNISEDLESLKRRTKLSQDTTEEGNFFSLVDAQLLSENFNTAKSALLNDIASAQEKDKIKTEMILIYYYLAKGLAGEALQLLQEQEEKKSPATLDEKFHIAKGLANFLLKRYDTAQEELSYGELVSSNEANFWRTLISTAKEPKAEDNIILSSYNYLIKEYPDEIRRRIALTGIESAFLAQDDLNVQNYIDIIMSSSNVTNKDALISYYTAKKLDLLGYPLNAIREYRNTANTTSEKYSAYARYNILDIEKRTGSIKNKQAVSEYEKLRYAWQEKQFKEKVLDALATTYAEGRDYSHALSTLQTLKDLVDPDKEDQVTQRMVKIFENIYINNQDSSSASLKSLALYNDYSWLAPLSKYYNAIIPKLADRLVAADLLDKAYEILSEQYTKGNLTPQERAVIGTRMALINLFNESPGEALNILDKTEHEDLTPTIIAHRRLIRAKALSALGEPEAALELLRDDYSKNGLMMKSEIYWDNNQWSEAADTIKYLIERPQEGKPLSKEQTQLVLDWATALKKAGKETVIVRLKNTFEPFFKDTPYSSAFKVLTDSFESNKIDLKEIDKAINNIAAFSSFARIYTDSLKSGPLSETIK